MSVKKIVVCGATGSQGGAVVDRLLARGGYDLVAFSRQPSSPKSQALQDRGVKVERGDLLDGDFLQEIFAGADGVFGMTQPWSPDYKKCDIEAERIQGKNIVEACRIARVPHLVITSIINFTGKPTGIPHADSKLEIEHYCRDSQIPHTVLQLATFFDNIGGAFFPINPRTIRGFVNRETKINYVACRDIGEVTATVFEQPEAYQGRVLKLIGDLVSGEDLVSCLTQLTARRRWYWVPPHWVMRLLAPEFLLMREAMEEYGRSPYLESMEEAVTVCRAEFPHMLCLEDYLRCQGYGQ